MKASQLLCLILCSLFFSGFNAWADEPKTEIKVVNDAVLVGQANTVRVKVLVPTWFTEPVYFDELEAVNMYSVKTDKSSYPTSEKVNGQLWTGIIREYTLVAMKAGDFNLILPPLQLKYADGAATITKTVTLPEVRFTATLPAKAAGLSPLIIAEDLSIEQTVNKPDTLRAGQSVKRQLNMAITGSSALFIPQLLNDTDNDFQRAYIRSPQVADNLDSRTGELLGTRVEIQDILLKTDGTLTLDEINLSYYQPSSDSIQTVTVPGQEITVKAAKLTWQKGLVMLLWLVIALIACVIIYKMLMRCYRAYQHSEAYQFKQLLLSAEAKKSLSHDISLWQKFWQLEYAKSTELEHDLHRLVIQFEAQQIPTTQWLQSLKNHRAKLISQKKGADIKLKPLNP